MRGEDVVRDYLTLAMRLDRLLPGSVDAGVGDLDRHDRIRREPRPAPAELVQVAGRLADALPADLEPDRAAFLHGQLVACEWTARRLAGQPVPYREEVLTAYGTRIELGSEDAYRAVHRELDALLPGPAPLSQRLARHRGRDEIPPERLGDGVHVLSAALRERTLCTAALPTPESVGYRYVDDAPWSALHHYDGGFRSRVTVNVGARIRRAQLAQLVAHEVYPGHHTERCRKEVGLVARGWHEHRVVLANTPQSLIAEGAAELGLRAVVGPGWGRWASAVLAEVGLGFDGDLAERLDHLTSALAPVRQDAALLLHDRRAPAEDVLAHLRRWMLVDEPRARQVLRFLRHPLWRTYTTAYVEGHALLRHWWEGDPRAERFRRLLDEPLTPGQVRAELASVRPGRSATERVTPTPTNDDRRCPLIDER